MNTWKALTVCVLISGCASSGVIPIGPDTYMINKTSGGGGFVSPSSIKAEIIKEGAEYCVKQGKDFMLVSTGEMPAGRFGNMPSAEIQFMCLAKDDPELTRPKLEPAPNIVIKNEK